MSVICAYLLYEFKLGFQASEICRKNCSEFEEDAVKERTVRHWFQKFAPGYKSLKEFAFRETDTE